MFCVDEGHFAPPFLGLGHDMERQGSFTGGLRAIDLNNAAFGYAADAKRDIQRQGAGGNGVHHDAGVLP